MGINEFQGILNFSLGFERMVNMYLSGLVLVVSGELGFCVKLSSMFVYLSRCRVYCVDKIKCSVFKL